MQIGAKLSVLNENVYIHIWIPASHPAVTWALRHVLDYSVKLRGANIWDAKHKTDFFNSFLIFLLYVYSRTRGGPWGASWAKTLRGQLQTLNLKAQLANAFFAMVNQMFGGSSQLPTTAKRAIIKALSTV